MKKRLFVLIMAIILLLSCTVGCGNKEEKPSAKEETTTTQNGKLSAETESKPQYVYQASFKPVDVSNSEYNIRWINYFVISDQYMFFTADCLTGETVTHVDEYSGESYSYDKTETMLFSLDTTTGTITKLDSPSIPIPEGTEGNSYVSSLAKGPNGTVLAAVSMESYIFDLPENFDPENDDRWNYYKPAESKCELIQYDTSGNKLSTTEIRLETENGFSYLYNLLMDENGYIYASDWENNYIFDQSGNLLAKLQGTGDQLVKISDTQIATFVYGEDGRSLKTIDPVAKDYGVEIPVSDRAWNLKPGFGEYQYLFDYNGVIYGHNEATGEDVKLFDWMDSDVNSNNIDNFSILADGRIVALERDHSKADNPTYTIVTMQQVDAATLPQKEQIVLACMYLDYNVRNEIIKFNKSHSDIRITVRDYSQYATDENYYAGITKLNTEILSGAMPDIIMTDNMPMDQYVGQGVLLDLWPMIDNDPELKREDLMTHFFDSLSVDGKLYQVNSYFNITTAAGNRDIVGDGSSWTLDDLLDCMKMLEPDATIFGKYDTKSGILSNCISRSIDRFIDWNSGQCSFDSKEFLDYLKFANQFPLEYDWESEEPEVFVSDQQKVRTGQQLLLQTGVWSFDDLQYNNAMFDGKISYVGYPSSEGNNNCFGTGGGMSITSGCSNPEAAWQFVRTILTEDYQRSDYYYQFPTNKHCFEEYVTKAMTPTYYIDSETGEQKEESKGTWWIDDNTTIEIYAMTEAEYNLFMDLYHSCKGLQVYNNEIMSLINEEVAPFFNGQKTAEEVANLIQNKVSLYVMEQR